MELLKITFCSPVAKDVDKMIEEAPERREKTVVLLVEDTEELKDKLIDFNIKL